MRRAFGPLRSARRGPRSDTSDIDRDPRQRTSLMALLKDVVVHRYVIPPELNLVFLRRKDERANVSRDSI